MEMTISETSLLSNEGNDCTINLNSDNIGINPYQDEHVRTYALARVRFMSHITDRKLSARGLTMHEHQVDPILKCFIFVYMVLF